MLPLTRRDIWRSIARAAVVFLVCAAPWPGLRTPWSAAYSTVANLALHQITFGRGGHARLRPAVGAELDAKEAVATDTIVQVTVTGHTGELLFGVSARRDAQLPLALLAAVLMAVPLPATRRIACLLAGMFVCVCASVGLLCVGVASFFAERLATVWAPSPFAKQALQLANSILLLPPANRFVLPLVLGVALVWCARRPPQTQTLAVVHSQP